MKQKMNINQTIMMSKDYRLRRAKGKRWPDKVFKVFKTSNKTMIQLRIQINKLTIIVLQQKKRTKMKNN